MCEVHTKEYICDVSLKIDRLHVSIIERSSPERRNKMFSVRDALVKCGVNDTVGFNNQTPAERIAEDIFSDSFITCMDKTSDELDEDFKSYSDLTLAQGQIRLTPGVRRNIRAFVQWTRDKFRLGEDPENEGYPVDDASDHIRRYKTHEKFVKDSKNLSEAAKPEKFKETTKWEDWNAAFLNYLRCLPGRDGVPLKYVCRENDMPDPTPNTNFLDDYVAMAPLNGTAYAIDAAYVHTLITNFISGNTVAESKIQQYEDRNDGRLDFIALKEHYQGVGAMSFDVTQAETDLQNLFYLGEKPPIMWWDEFERRLTRAFVIIDKKEKRQVYSDEMKLRILMKKVRADFLGNAKTSVQLKLIEVPVVFTYENAIQLFRNVVNTIYPKKPNSRPNTRRVMSEVGSVTNNVGGRSEGRGRGNWKRARLQGRGGRGRGRGRFTQRDNPTRPDSSYIVLTNGRRIEFHPDITYTPSDYHHMKRVDRERLHALRQEKRERDAMRRQINELQSQVSIISQASSRMPTPLPPLPPLPSQIQGPEEQSTIATQSMGGSFSGRNNQLNRNRN